MRIQQRQLSTWWLLAIVPGVLIFLVMLPFLLVVGGHVLGGVLGPPAIWEMPRHDLSMTELAGTYVEAANNVYGTNAYYENAATLTKGSALFQLNTDGSAVISGIPQEDSRTWSSPHPTLCLLSGNGFWVETHTRLESKLSVKLDISTSSNLIVEACKEINVSLAEFTGQRRPFGLYLPVGDPDSGIGLHFRQILPKDQAR